MIRYRSYRAIVKLKITTRILFFRNVKSLWRPEYGSYMIEGTPGKPYGGLLAHFNIVEANMRYRRDEAQRLLGEDEVLMTITNFPRYVHSNFLIIHYSLYYFVKTRRCVENKGE